MRSSNAQAIEHRNLSHDARERPVASSSEHQISPRSDKWRWRNNQPIDQVLMGQDRAKRPESRNRCKISTAELLRLILSRWKLRFNLSLDTLPSSTRRRRRSSRRSQWGLVVYHRFLSQNNRQYSVRVFGYLAARVSPPSCCVSGRIIQSARRKAIIESVLIRV
jgi:hypothetical protein